MVSPGIIARPSVCLRCQLREVLLQARLSRRRIQPRSIRCNAFSTGPRRSQEAGEDLLVGREKPYYWKKVKTPERVIGRPGRRQRVVSERLSRNSLEKPANVIVFKDVAEEPELQSIYAETDTLLDNEPRPKALTAKEIENAITGRYVAPAEAEVNLSIDGLRPDQTVVDESGFEEHKQKLMKGYTYPQLSKYLIWSLHASTSGKALREESSIDDVHELGNTKWHAGQTPLSQRHAKVTRKAGPTTKKTLVEQVLRLVWHLTVQSEQQEIGELEVKLQPWQVSMLFDILHNDRPHYQSFIRSRFLLEKTQVNLWRPHGIVRVTGRRQDAEEVARQLKLALIQVERLLVDFKPFLKMLDKGSRQIKAPCFNTEELSYVSNLTRTVITAKGDDIVAIYGIGEAARHNARRLLLALLDLPGVTSFDAVSKARCKPNTERATKAKLPVDLSSGLHRRYRKMDLVREAEPCRANYVGSAQPSPPASEFGPGAILDEDGTLSKAMVDELASVPLPKQANVRFKRHAESYWNSGSVLTSWKVELGRMLNGSESVSTLQAEQPNKSPAVSGFTMPGSRQEKAVFQHQVPGLQTVLSFFEGGHVDRRPPRAWNMESVAEVPLASNTGPYLIAHFVPSPTKSSTKLPRLQIRIKIASPRPNAPKELWISKIMAIMDEQQLSAPFPEYAVDMQFSRRLTVTARLNHAGQDPGIQDFATKLRESAQRHEGVLVAPPEVTFKLPQWFLDRKRQHPTPPDVEVKYLFERFEQVQRVRFTPRQKILEKKVDEGIKSVVRSMPGDMILDYREIESGAIYGSRTMLGLRTGVSILEPAPADQNESLVQEAYDSSTPDAQQSPTLDTDTATMSKSEPSESPEGAGEESQAGTTHHSGEHGQAAPESASVVHDVEQNAESSKDPTAKTRELVSMAMRLASLLTRAASGSLKQYASQK